jgi:hypothetical protein
MEQPPTTPVASRPITILGLRFKVRWPYKAGDICITKAEADALNRARVKNIRNDLAAMAKNRTLTQADGVAYEASYVFKRVAGLRTQDPFEAEALEIARRLVRTKGQSKKEITNAARELLQSEKGDAIRRLAAKRLAELEELRKG